MNMDNARTRTITWEDPAAGARDADSISGLDYLRAIIAGAMPTPPVGMLLGYRLVEIAHGRAVFELQAAEYHYNPFATVHGGVIATLLDSAMTAAVMSTLGIGVSCSTVEFKVNFIRPITIRTRTLRCEAEPVHVGKRLATVNGWLRDAAGELYAHGVGTCAMFQTR